MKNIVRVRLDTLNQSKAAMKFRAVVCAVLLISITQASLFNKAIRSFQANLDAALEKNEVAIWELESKALKMFVNIELKAKEMLTESQNTIEDAKEIISKIEENQIEECHNLTQGLSQGMNNMTSWVDEQAGLGKQFIERISNITIGSIANFYVYRLIARNCRNDSITDFVSGAEVIDCLESVLHNATRETAERLRPMIPTFRDLSNLSNLLDKTAFGCIDNCESIDFMEEYRLMIIVAQNCVASSEKAKQKLTLAEQCDDDD